MDRKTAYNTRRQAHDNADPDEQSDFGVLDGYTDEFIAQLEQKLRDARAAHGDAVEVKIHSEKLT